LPTQEHGEKDTIQLADFHFVDKGNDIKIDISLSFIKKSQCK
jgi:hypothetical protein